MKVIYRVLLPIMLPTLVCSALAKASTLSPETLIGTWKMDLAKSNFGTGPAETAQILVISKDADGRYLMTAEYTDTEGKSFKAEWASRFDWHVEPLSGVPGVESVQEKLVGPRTWKIDFLNKGHVIEFETVRVSADGKVMQATAVPPKSDKEQWTIHMWFDRQ